MCSATAEVPERAAGEPHGPRQMFLNSRRYILTLLQRCSSKASRHCMLNQRRRLQHGMVSDMLALHPHGDQLLGCAGHRLGDKEIARRDGLLLPELLACL